MMKYHGAAYLSGTVKEAYLNNDNKMCNHLKEIFVLCKMCLWNYDRFF